MAWEASRCPPTEWHGACAVGRSRPGVSRTRIGCGGRGLLSRAPDSLRLLRPQREVTTWRNLSKSCVPPSPASLSGPPFSSRPFGPPALSLRSSLASQAPPFLQGPPHISTGDLRRLWPRRHEETPGLTSAADGAAMNGRGFLASSVAETPELQSFS